MPAARTVAAVVKASLADKPPELKQTVRGLRALIAATAPDATETVNPWGLLSFEAGGSFAALLFASRHVSLVFARGTSLPDKAGLLEGTGKNLRHVKLRTPADLANPGLAALVKAAVALNGKEPPNTMGGPMKKVPPRKPSAGKRRTKRAG